MPALLATLLCLAWLLPGLVGHDPWKGEEAQAIGFVHSLLAGAPPAIPTLAGEPWPVNPPLYHLSAAVFAQALAGWLPVHDAARLAGGFFVLLTLIFAGLAGRELYGREHGWLVILVLIGSIGWLVRAHEAIPQSALLAGVALSGYGLALSLRRPVTGGALAGTGIGVVFMSIGVPETLALILAASLLPAFSPAWRTTSTLKASLAALLFALPWLVSWPLALYQLAPAVFAEWWRIHTLERFAVLAPGGGIGTLYYLTFLPWFAWPAWPLALWAVWQARRNGLALPGIALPLALFASLLTMLSLTNQAREINGLPLLLPLAWLAAAGTRTLRRGAGNALYWFAVMTFLVLAVAAWVYWSGLELGVPARLSTHLHKIQPGYVSTFRPIPVTVALLATLTWLVLLVKLKRSPQRPLIAWAAGVTLAWVLAASLFIHPMNERMSYRGMIAQLGTVLPPQGCVASQGLATGVRAMLDYHIGLRTLRVETTSAAQCPLLLVQSQTGDARALPPGEWREIWEGHRPGNRSERFRLYQRATPTA